MVGIFQIFSFSFLFWMIVSLLRFIFETLETFRKFAHARAGLSFFLAWLAGVAASISLFLLLLFEFDLHILFYTEGIISEASLTVLILWLICIAAGSYLATRLYPERSYAIALTVSSAAVATGLLLIALSFPLESFTSKVAIWFLGEVLVTVISGLLGGHIAGLFNVTEQRRRSVISVKKGEPVYPHDVAVVIAAHNEELTIGATIGSLLQITTPEHIFIGSDGSVDKTAEVVRSYGCHADEIQPNRGKAGALTYVLRTNNLLTRYKAVFLLDADITVDQNFYKYTLPYFEDPKIAAVSGYFSAVWPPHLIPRWSLLVTAYRIRLWRVLQFLVRYGQTWKYINESPIIPGGGSVYRSSVLSQITIDAPGLVIEDFNMTFEVHRKKLGLIVFEPKVLVHDQEPYSLSDFIKQIKRWYLGFFQTARRHGVWPSWFCFFTYSFTLELLISSFFFLLLPFFVLELVLGNKEVLFLDFVVFGFPVTMLSILTAAFLFDYAITVIVAIIERKPLMLVYGLAFFPLRYIESVIFISMLPMAFLKKSDGRWVSPKRIAHEPQV